MFVLVLVFVFLLVFVLMLLALNVYVHSAEHVYTLRSVYLADSLRF